MHHSHSWEANSSSANEENSHILCNQNVFIAVFTSVRQLFLSRARLIQSTALYPIYRRPILRLSFQNSHILCNQNVFIAVFTSVRQLFLSRARLIHSTALYPIYRRPILGLSFHLRAILLGRFFPPRFPPPPITKPFSTCPTLRPSSPW